MDLLQPPLPHKTMSMTHIHALVASGAVTIDLDWTFLAQFLAFTLFVMVMKQLIFDPLIRMFEERSKRTHGAKELAREMDEQAIALKHDLDERAEDVRREAAVDREKSRAKLKKLELAESGKTRNEVGSKLEEGMAKLDAEVVTMRADLNTQRDELAAEIASRVLGRSVVASAGGQGSAS
jgi:F-type H+-transporting ATPase subunit b